MTSVDEIAPDLYRICTYKKPPYDLQFCQFLLKDDEPLLFHTGYHAHFSSVRSAVASVLDPATLRWIAFSHYEADECGALNEWLAVAPESLPLCSITGKLVSVDDVAHRPAKPMTDGDVIETGKHRLRFLQTPHVPHGWDAGLLFDETTGTLFASDLGSQNGDGPALTEESIVEATRASIKGLHASPMKYPYPYVHYTEETLERLAALQPKVLAIMHGASFAGDGAGELRGIAAALKETMGGAS